MRRFGFRMHKRQRPSKSLVLEATNMDSSMVANAPMHMNASVMCSCMMNAMDSGVMHVMAIVGSSSSNKAASNESSGGRCCNNSWLGRLCWCSDNSDRCWLRGRHVHYDGRLGSIGVCRHCCCCLLCDQVFLLRGFAFVRFDFISRCIEFMEMQDGSRARAAVAARRFRYCGLTFCERVAVSCQRLPAPALSLFKTR